jgi:hypothetical protein
VPGYSYGHAGHKTAFFSRLQGQRAVTAPSLAG